MIELFVLFKEDVLGFEISMYYVVLVTVVDTRKYLLKKHCSVPFTELSALEYLVKQLTTFTDLSNQVVSLFIFEELVHLYNVRVIL